MLDFLKLQYKKVLNFGFSSPLTWELNDWLNVDNIGMQCVQRLHKCLYNCTPLNCGLINFFSLVRQDDLAQKQKLKDEKKALEQAKAKAAQKGPMGRYISHLRFLVTHCHENCL